MSFVSSSALALGLLATLAAAKAPYCLATDSSCFPSEATLSAFNASIGGRLSSPPPYGRVCYEGHYDAAACETLVQRKWETPTSERNLSTP